VDFVLTALFVVLFIEKKKKKENRIMGMIGIVCSILSLLIFGADQMVIPAMILIVLFLSGGRKKLCI
jgi:4-azaleucine resistance transporter AzlC